MGQYILGFGWDNTFVPGPTLNNADWFGYPRYLSAPATGVPAQPYTLPLTPDPATIAALMESTGFATMRIFVDPVPFITLAGAQLAAAYALLLGTINIVTNAGIQVIVVLAPPTSDPNAGNWSGADLTNPSNTTYFPLYATLVQTMASKLGTSNNPTLVAFELLNEPNISDASRWQTMLATLVAAARAANSTMTLIVSGCNLSDRSGLVLLSPLSDTNVLYTFHYYEPFSFTHQGASFAGTPTSGFSKLPYPADLIGLTGSLPSGGDASWRAIIGLYAWNHNEALIQSEFAAIKAWATANHVLPQHIFLGEFGVHTPSPLGALPADRARWVSAVRFAAEKALFTWGFFHLDGEFGLLQNTIPLSFDPVILSSLDLGPSVQTSSSTAVAAA